MLSIKNIIDQHHKKYIPLISFGLLFFIAQCFVNFYEGDDTYFLNTASSMNIISFVTMRYKTWSGRIVSEFLIALFTKMPLMVWRLVNTGIAVYFVYLLTNLVKLPFKHLGLTEKEQLIINGFVAASFFMIPISVTTRGCSWFTGSFFYLWPACCLFVALLPFLKQLYKQKVSTLLYVCSFICSIYASFMEQSAAILICFSALSLLFLYKRDYHEKNFKILLPLVLQLILNGICLTLYSLAPGNVLRNASETQTWYPEFSKLSLIQKILQGINWTHHHLIRENTYLMLTLSLFLFLLALPKLKKLALKGLAFVPCLYFIGSLLPLNQIVARATSYEYNFDVQAIADQLLFNPMQGILPAIVSLSILCIIGLLLCIVLGRHTTCFICILFYLAALAAGYILGLSPTIFASGPRIFFITDILLVLINTMLFILLIKKPIAHSLTAKISYLIYLILGSGFSVMYIGGIAIKSIFHIK